VTALPRRPHPRPPARHGSTPAGPPASAPWDRCHGAATASGRTDSNHHPVVRARKIPATGKAPDAQPDPGRKSERMPRAAATPAPWPLPIPLLPSAAAALGRRHPAGPDEPGSAMAPWSLRPAWAACAGLAPVHKPGAPDHECHGRSGGGCRPGGTRRETRSNPVHCRRSRRRRNPPP